MSNDVMKGMVKGFPLTYSYHYISKFIKDKRIRDYLAFQTMYIGVNPMKSSNMYTLIPVISAIKGLWYLKGGMNSFVLALEEYIRKNGGTIYLNTKCEKLLVKENYIKSVVTDKGVLSADVVICNSDYSYSKKTYFNKNLNENKSVKDRKFNYSCSVFMLYIGLKKKYECLAVHNMYIGSNFKKNIEAAFKGKIPSEPPLYIYCPSKIDSTMAPEGKDAINVMIRVPNTSNKKIIWNEKLVIKIRDRLIQTLQKVNGLEDINANIEFESYLTPNDLEVKFNSFYGNAFGISHNLTQTAFLRPQIKSRDFNNLYFIGDSVHPGTGVALVLLGSKLLCEYL
jgi:phytoene desaturase